MILSPVNAGSNKVIGVSFHDLNGNYIPQLINYTVLALNSSGGDYKVVNERFQISVTPASSIEIILDSTDLALIPGTTNDRRVLLYWEYEREGNLVKPLENIDFKLNNPSVIRGL